MRTPAKTNGCGTQAASAHVSRVYARIHCDTNAPANCAQRSIKTIKLQLTCPPASDTRTHTHTHAGTFRGWCGERTHRRRAPVRRVILLCVYVRGICTSASARANRARKHRRFAQGGRQRNSASCLEARCACEDIISAARSAFRAQTPQVSGLKSVVSASKCVRICLHPIGCIPC